jgi:hypothetical protein
LDVKPPSQGNGRGAHYVRDPEPVDTRPTHDQIYLAERINQDAAQGHLSVPAIQRLNNRYGPAAVTVALRMLRGFPPEKLTSAYAYLATMLKGET